MVVRITPRMCKAARAFLGWQQADLGTSSGVSKSTIGAFEAKEEVAYLTSMNLSQKTAAAPVSAFGCARMEPGMSTDAARRDQA